MYTSDVKKNKKVWHDGQVRLHHVNSKAYLYSERSERLAESFLKVAACRSYSNDRATTGASCQIPEQFELMEDEEIEFDEVEDSHQLRAGQFLAQIVALIGIEHKVLSIATPSEFKSHQEHQKRRMEFLDEQIKQFDKPKRRRPSSPSTSSESLSATTSTPSRTEKDAHTSPTKPISTLRKRALTPFQSKPFQSPLLHRTVSVPRAGPKPSHMTPSREDTRTERTLDSPAPGSPSGDRIGKLKTLNLNWKPFCEAPEGSD
ncbi:hypothetical protein CROQUDRAFT_672178 [Cronartium quercuum f. sp. fusiforme G11]|uniref:5'-3' DNA helicase ZGRF1-like N-terminal domain-containing protein n=1 Tax=Cronartium quercuum f. sp. fusiforme G11 TaxID=708437 RepID=A0A9P6NFQ2_9BASI|nr:hypothetical protein CROQUDRAFT_672178 [Cronartium quercuum f. sp. fusiforme G11]